MKSCSPWPLFLPSSFPPSRPSLAVVAVPAVVTPLPLASPSSAWRPAAPTTLATPRQEGPGLDPALVTGSTARRHHRFLFPAVLRLLLASALAFVLAVPFSLFCVADVLRLVP